MGNTSDPPSRGGAVMTDRQKRLRAIFNSATLDLRELDRLVMDAAAPIPSLKVLLDQDDRDLHMPAIKGLLGIVDSKLGQIADAVIRLNQAEGARS